MYFFPFLSMLCSITILFFIKFPNYFGRSFQFSFRHPFSKIFFKFFPLILKVFFSALALPIPLPKITIPSLILLKLSLFPSIPQYSSQFSRFAHFFSLLFNCLYSFSSLFSSFSYLLFSVSLTSCLISSLPRSFSPSPKPLFLSSSAFLFLPLHLIISSQTSPLPHFRPLLPISPQYQQPPVTWINERQHH